MGTPPGLPGAGAEMGTRSQRGWVQLSRYGADQSSYLVSSSGTGCRWLRVGAIKQLHKCSLVFM